MRLTRSWLALLLVLSLQTWRAAPALGDAVATGSFSLSVTFPSFAGSFVYDNTAFTVFERSRSARKTISVSVRARAAPRQ